MAAWTFGYVCGFLLYVPRRRGYVLERVDRYEYHGARGIHDVLYALPFHTRFVYVEGNQKDRQYNRWAFGVCKCRILSSLNRNQGILLRYVGLVGNRTTDSQYRACRVPCERVRPFKNERKMAFSRGVSAVACFCDRRRWDAFCALEGRFVFPMRFHRIVRNRYDYGTEIHTEQYQRRSQSKRIGDGEKSS